MKYVHILNTKIYIIEQHAMQTFNNCIVKPKKGDSHVLLQGVSVFKQKNYILN